MIKNYVIMLVYDNATANEWMSFNTLSAAENFKQQVTSEKYIQNLHITDAKLFEVRRDVVTNNLILHEIV